MCAQVKFKRIVNTALLTTRKSQFNSEFAEETGVQKFKRRLKEEPLIPLGKLNKKRAIGFTFLLFICINP